MAATSLPASGSEEQNAASLTSPGPPNICGSHSPICSLVPLDDSATAASELPVSDRAMPASPQNSSSKAIGMPRPVGPSHCSPKNSSEYRPILAASSRIGHGVSSRSSHSAAAGLMTFAAKPCTQSCISRRPGPGSRLNAGVSGALLMLLLRGPVATPMLPMSSFGSTASRAVPDPGASALVVAVEELIHLGVV